MKKIIFSAAVSAILGIAITSCGGGCAADNVNNDTIVSTQLSDSLSMQLGAAYGVFCNNVVSQQYMADYIEGFQLLTAQPYSSAKIKGFQDALKILEAIKWFEDNEVKFNRNLFLQQFRNYVQKPRVSIAEREQIYSSEDELQQRISEIIMLRENMRNQALIEQVKQITITDIQPSDFSEAIDVEESVETVEVANATPGSSSDSSDVPM